MPTDTNSKTSAPSTHTVNGKQLPALRYVAAQLGHPRPEISHAYAGSLPAMSVRSRRSKG